MLLGPQVPADCYSESGFSGRHSVSQSCSWLRHFCSLNLRLLWYVTYSQGTRHIASSKSSAQNKGCFGFGYVYPTEGILNEPSIKWLSAGEFSGLPYLLLYQIAVLDCPWHGRDRSPFWYLHIKVQQREKERSQGRPPLLKDQVEPMQGAF